VYQKGIPNHFWLVGIIQPYRGDEIARKI